MIHFTWFWSQDLVFLDCFGLLGGDSSTACFKLHTELQLAATHSAAVSAQPHKQGLFLHG